MTAPLVVPSSPAIHAPPGLPGLGQLLDAWRDPLGLFLRGMAGGHAVVRYRFGPYTYLLLNEPGDVERVLVKNAQAYGKSPSYRALRLVMGQGLVTSEGELWRRQRKLMQPAFHHRCLVGFVGGMEGCVSDLAARWDQLPEGTTFDVHREMMELTFRIVGRTLFSTEVGAEAEGMGEALGFLLEYASDYAETLVRMPTWLPTPRNRRFARSMATVDRLIARVVAERRAASAAPDDLLGMLLAADMDDRQLRDELVTLALAGHETTANALTWTWLLLSQHPEVARRARQEVLQELGDGPLTFEALGRLGYLERVIQESMRLYPPVWGIERQLKEPDEHSGHPARPGDIALLCSYTLHRDPRLWTNPEGFDPDRFLPEHVARRPRFAYLPFGGGARICIGKAFAMLEAKLILAGLLRRFELALVPGHPVVLDPGITLRPRHGLGMTLRRAAASGATGPS